MRNFIATVLLLLTTTCLLIGQGDKVSRKVNPSDSLTVSFKFENIRLTDNDKLSQEKMYNLVSQFSDTNRILANNMTRFADAVEGSTELRKQTQIDIIASEMNLPPETIKQAFKKNAWIKFIIAIPALIYLIAGCSTAIRTRGVDTTRS